MCQILASRQGDRSSSAIRATAIPIPIAAKHMAVLSDKTRAQIVSRVLATRQERAQRLAQMKLRQQRGWKVARRAAQILQQEFGVQRVVLFGSMLDHERMTCHSDIDLAVWGLPEQDYFRAGAAVERGHEFSIDLVEVQHARPELLASIQQGVEL